MDWMENLLSRFMRRKIFSPGECDSATQEYIAEEIHRINYRRLRIIILIPLLLGLLSLLFSFAGFGNSGRFIRDLPRIIILIRTLGFGFMVLVLFKGNGHSRHTVHIAILVWILLILSLTYSVMDISTMIQLILDLFLLNLFIFLPPRISFATNVLTYALFVLFRFIHDTSTFFLLDRGGDDMLLPMLITFFILVAVISYLSFYEFKDMIGQIYRRKMSADQVETIKRQKEELERFNHMRNHIDRIVRHDLKSPLNGIIGSAQVLRETEDEGKSELVSLIEQSGYKMLHMINNSLDLYHMEEGTYETEYESFELCELLEEQRREVASLAQMKELALEYRYIPPEAEGSIVIEAERIKIASMLANLIQNAMEASPKSKSVTVTVDARGEELLKLDIHNIGTIPEEIRSSFFECYVTSGKRDGTGLGTYSARLIAEAHGGAIDFTTSGTGGTHLFVQLPRTQRLRGGSKHVNRPAARRDGAPTH
jgi:signal transduction histidine kinase